MDGAEVRSFFSLFFFTFVLSWIRGYTEYAEGEEQGKTANVGVETCVLESRKFP